MKSSFMPPDPSDYDPDGVVVAIFTVVMIAFIAGIFIVCGYLLGWIP